MTRLSIEGLNVRHGLLQAVKDVSFSVGQGETLALVGANGAGKTTLLRAIAGAHLPSGGRIVFDGTDVTAMPAYKRVGRGIALVPEGRRLFAQMTVEENLLVGRQPPRANAPTWTPERLFYIIPNMRELRRSAGPRLSEAEAKAVLAA